MGLQQTEKKKNFRLQCCVSEKVYIKKFEIAPETGWIHAILGRYQKTCLGATASECMARVHHPDNGMAPMRQDIGAGAKLARQRLG